jgi:hypothetical protein
MAQARADFECYAPHLRAAVARWLANPEER